MNYSLSILFCALCGGLLVSCSSIPEYSHGTIRVSEADKTDHAVMKDSIWAIAWKMDDAECSRVFAKEYKPYGIQPYLLSFSNHSPYDIEFHASSIPHYYSAQKVYNDTYLGAVGILAAETVGGFLSPLFIAVAQISSGVPEEERTPINGTTFLVGGAVGFVVGAVDAAQIRRNNNLYEDYLHEVAAERLIIPSGYNGFTVVFTKDANFRGKTKTDMAEVIPVADTLSLPLLRRITGDTLLLQVPVER